MFSACGCEDNSRDLTAGIARAAHALLFDSPAAELERSPAADATSSTKSMTRSELLAFMCSQHLAVQASCTPEGGAQAALVGIAVTDAFEIIFDTLDTTRKARNLRTSPCAAFVLGGWIAGDERTVQFEGIADEPLGAELARIKKSLSPPGETVPCVNRGPASPIFVFARPGFDSATSTLLHRKS